MAKAEGFVLFDFSIHVAFLRSLGRHRMPPLLRRRAIDALLRAIMFPPRSAGQSRAALVGLSNGLATESGRQPVDHPSHPGAEVLAELGLITHRRNMTHRSGCNIPDRYHHLWLCFPRLTFQKWLWWPRAQPCGMENLQRKTATETAGDGRTDRKSVAVCA